MQWFENRGTSVNALIADSLNHRQVPPGTRRLASAAHRASLRRVSGHRHRHASAPALRASRTRPELLLLASLTAAGLFYLLSLYFVRKPETSVTILLLGRAVLDRAESFIITGVLSLELTVMGAQNTGKVLAWVGTALYAAFAVGAPFGTTLYASDGFMAIALATILIPLVTLLLAVFHRQTQFCNQWKMV
jgi:hypothetical protein